MVRYSGDFLRSLPDAVLTLLSRIHPCRIATSGYTFVARRAGKKHAGIATTAGNKGVAIKVIGSAALTPNNKPVKLG